MKKMKIAIATLLLPIFAQADGEFSMQDVNASIQPSIQTPLIEYHNRMAVFGPMHQVYERIKTDAFYAGVETWAKAVIDSKSSDCILGEAELRLGYNFFYNGRDHVTPFIGGGALKNYKLHNHGYWLRNDGSHHTFKKVPIIGYGVLGFLYDHEFNSIFNLGFNLKGLLGSAAHKTHKEQWGSFVYGFDAALPVTFRFGYKRHWDIRIEPFNVYLHGKNESINFFGFRNTIGYRF